jgi:hypothetical protein
MYVCIIESFGYNFGSRIGSHAFPLSLSLYIYLHLHLHPHPHPHSYVKDRNGGIVPVYKKSLNSKLLTSGKLFGNSPAVIRAGTVDAQFRVSDEVVEQQGTLFAGLVFCVMCDVEEGESAVQCSALHCVIVLLCHNVLVM